MALSTAKTPSKKSGQDETSPKRANNVTIGTLGEVRGAEGDGSENGGYKLDDDQKYVYRDFSQIPEEDFDVDYEIDQEGLLQVRLPIPTRPDLILAHGCFSAHIYRFKTSTGPRRFNCSGSGTNDATSRFGIAVPSVGTASHESFGMGSFSKIVRSMKE